MGTFLSGEARGHEHKVLPLSMPKEVPLYFSDFEHDSDIELFEVVRGTIDVSDGKFKGLGADTWNDGKISPLRMPNDVEVEAYARSLGTWSFYDLVYRFTDPDDGYGVWFCEADDWNSIKRIDADTPTIILPLPAGFVREWHHFRFIRRGGYLAFYKNDVLQGETTDDTYVRPWVEYRMFSKGMAEWEWIVIRKAK